MELLAKATNARGAELFRPCSLLHIHACCQQHLRHSHHAAKLLMTTCSRFVAPPCSMPCCCGWYSRGGCWASDAACWPCAAWGTTRKLVFQSFLPAKLILGTANDTASTCHVPDRVTLKTRPTVLPDAGLLNQAARIACSAEGCGLDKAGPGDQAGLVKLLRQHAGFVQLTVAEYTQLACVQRAPQEQRPKWQSCQILAACVQQHGRCMQAGQGVQAGKSMSMWSRQTLMKVEP